MSASLSCPRCGRPVERLRVMGARGASRIATVDVGLWSFGQVHVGPSGVGIVLSKASVAARPAGELRRALHRCPRDQLARLRHGQTSAQSR